MLSRRRIIIAMAALTAASPAASLAARAAASCPRLQAERRAPLQQDFTHACGTPAAAAGTGTTGAGAVIRCTPVRDVCLRRASPDERAQGRALQTALVSLKRLCRSKCQSISRVMSNCCGRSFPERVFTKMASFEQQPLMTGGRRCSTEERFFSAPPP